MNIHEKLIIGSNSKLYAAYIQFKDERDFFHLFIFDAYFAITMNAVLDQFSALFLSLNSRILKSFN